MKNTILIIQVICVLQIQSVSCQTINSSTYNDIHKSIIYKLNINDDEKNLAENAFEYLDYADQWMKDANNLEEDKAKLSKIMELSGSYKDIHSKAKRKYQHLSDYQLSLQYDAEEYLELANSMLFDIYKNHEKEIYKKTNSDAKELITNAKKLFKKAGNIRDNVYYNIQYELGIPYLCQAQSYENQALLYYEKAYLLCLNEPVDNPYFSHNFIVEYQQQQEQNKKKELVADITPLTNDEISGEYRNKDNEAIAISEESTENTNTNKVIYADNTNYEQSHYNNFVQKNIEPETPAENTTKHFETTNFKSRNIVFKVQIGAFKNPVSPNQFHGLTPLSSDNSDKNFACKYVVGNYYSYKAAAEAKNIIANTSPYKDAFIVAYVDGERTDINTALLNTSNEENHNYAYKH